MMNTLTNTSHSWDDSETLSLIMGLEKLGILRAIDAQFALFIYQQIITSSHATQSMTKNEAEHLALLACLVSAEFGRGHICLLLDELDVAKSLSLAFVFRQHPEWLEQYGALVDTWLQQDWLSLVADYANRSDAIIRLATSAQGLQAVPMMIEGNRLYLTRYWYYEQQVAHGLMERANTLSQSSAALSLAKQTLNDLFARDYSYLWRELQTGKQDSLALRQRLVCEMLDVVETESLDWTRIDECLVKAKSLMDLTTLDSLVPNSVCLNWQKVAASLALTRQFAVISGGPGTGKTTTVAKLLAALIVQAQPSLHSENGIGAPIIKLVAPTGKAAARLTESIGLAIAQLPVTEQIKAAIPAQSSTIHRLLGARPNTVEYKYNRANPLHLDILVVDEASMVDLPMMYRLLQALPAHARLILLGDKDQLASVEAGAILGDLCQFASVGYQSELHQRLTELTGFATLPASSSANLVSDSLCMLQKSYRFHARSGVGQLAKAINSGNEHLVEKVWQQGFSDIRKHEVQARLASQVNDNALSVQEAQSAICTMMHQAYQAYCEGLHQPLHSVDGALQGDLFAEPVTPSKTEMEQKARTILNAFSHARLLCAVREGEFGVERMNGLIEQGLAQQKCVTIKEGEAWYIGRPIMVTQNDSAQGLHNGDIGICLLDESEAIPRLRVYFEMPDGRIKGVLPSRVPKHELAFAMTIHKSQGSEFSHTVMVLPNQMNPILTRELIYTGVTRAKERLDMFVNTNILAQGVRVKTLRHSGLSQKLLSK